MTDMTVIVHPTQSGHVRVVVSADGPAEALMTPDEARELARRLLWAVRVADDARMRGLDDEVGVGLTDPGGDETWRCSRSRQGNRRDGQMAVKERTLTQEIAWRLADVYAAQTQGNYDEETLFDRGGDWAADEVGKVLSERLGVPTEALEAGVVREMVEALEWFMRRSGLDEGDGGDGLLIPAGDTAEIKRRFGTALERVRGGDRSA